MFISLRGRTETESVLQLANHFHQMKNPTKIHKLLENIDYLLLLSISHSLVKKSLSNNGGKCSCLSFYLCDRYNQIVFEREREKKKLEIGLAWFLFLDHVNEVERKFRVYGVCQGAVCLFHRVTVFDSTLNYF